MTNSCSPRRDGQSPTRDQHQHRAPALDLLDEYWFFNNTLGNNKSSSRSRLLRPKEEEGDAELIQQGKVEVEVEDDDLNWSSIYEGVLRTRIADEASSSRSLLHRAPSMPLPAAAAPSTTVPRRLRHSHSTLLERNCRRNHPKLEVERGNKQLRLFQSSRDLESMEVQGFKDLGFVFDKEELRESLADVLPGLRAANRAQADRARRPYLSEAWQQPAMRRRNHYQQPSGEQWDAAVIRRLQESEAAEMKDKLRMWAQAVACNVRHQQDC